MNSLTITNILKKSLGSSFKGVYSFDQWRSIPSTSSTASYIFNTAPHTEEFGHWIAIKFFKNRTAIFFDSYGRSPATLGFESFLEKHSESWKYNNITIQSLFSTVCGQHAIFFLQKLSSSNLNKWISNFSTDLISNDKLVLDYINEKYKLSLSLYPSVEFYMNYI